MNTGKTAASRLDVITRETMQPLTKLFESEPTRVQNMSFEVGEIYADFSKQRICPLTLQALHSLAHENGVDKSKDQLFSGASINRSENRAVLHPALRSVGGSAEVQNLVTGMRARMRDFAETIRNSGKYKAIIHIGIGGSDLGPRLCADALRATQKSKLELRFVENIDGASINDALRGLDPQTTLVITVSKTFSTQETLMNAKAARAWLQQSLGNAAGHNMIAVTANRAGAESFGISPTQIFDFWDWVGGRYSLWSAVSLSLQIAFGPDAFDQLLGGGAEMDIHFKDTPIEKNLPVMLALTGIWNRNYLNYDSQAVICYSRRLRKLPAFLQQLEMESNGKSVKQNGQKTGLTCPIIWGDEGTNSQHAFFQYLHQGTNGAPVDFIAVSKDHENRPAHHRVLLANCFAQSEALMVGKPEGQVREELNKTAFSNKEIENLAPQKTFPGNRPSTTILLNELSPRAIGNLIALYEHKVFIQSIIWGINAFDQWGVELGKSLATTILSEIETSAANGFHDQSTTTLIKKSNIAVIT